MIDILMINQEKKVNFFNANKYLHTLFRLMQSVCYYTSVAAVMKWFPGRTGLMGSICIAGFGFGSVIWNPLETQFVNPDNVPPEDIPGDNSEDKWVTSMTLLD